MAKEDRTDPICEMKGTIKAHGHYFCSQSCIKKYEKKHNIKSCPSCYVKVSNWYQEKIFIWSLITVILAIASYFIYKPLFNALFDYFKLIWWAILLGIFLGGLIDYFIPRKYIEKVLGRQKKRTILYSVLFGFIMSACSHGILAISMELYKKGAKTSSVIAFLLASPWANLPITILFFSFFGWKALFIVFSAIVIAIITGLIYQLLEKKSLVETNHAKDEKFSIMKDIRERMKKKFEFSKAFKGVMQSSWDLAKMILWWILIGMIIASIARAFVPQDFFIQYMGATILGIIVVLVFATIIEVCSEGSAPMAFEIFKQTGAFGNSFVFLMAGVVTDYTEIGLIWNNIGRKAAIWLPIITVPQVLLLGYLFNILL